MNKETLKNLATNNLTNYRSDRYDGGGFSVQMHDFSLEDVSLVLQIYRTVKKIYDLWLYMKDDPNYGLFENEIKELSSDRFLNLVRGVGIDTYSNKIPTETMRKVVHDIRGGALGALIGYSSIILNKGLTEESVKMMIFFARDHAKMMRNAILDIDPSVRLADESAKVHHINDFIIKWNNAHINLGTSDVLIHAESDFNGYITNRCLETSAIDRILYNFINNAARFSDDQKVSLDIIQVNDDLVRWVVSNKISADQMEWIKKATDNNTSKLFMGGITRNGHGIGLSSSLGFVSSGFGISNNMALENKYIGSDVIDLTYYAWFHWPVFTK